MFRIYIKIYKKGGCPERQAKLHLRLFFFVGEAQEVAIHDSFQEVI